MANEDDSVKSSSFAIFIWVSQHLISFVVFPEKRLDMVSTRNKTQMFFPRRKESASTRIRFFYLLRFRNKEFVMVAGSSS